MITFLEGVIEEKQPTHVVMNVGGVGYEVVIPLSSYDRLPGLTERCRILTYDHIREDAHQLFGFMTEGERRMFVLLLTVSGIGPKLALTTLSGLAIRELKVAIAEGDVKRLSSVSGIGKKTAERMVVELRDKLGAGEVLEASAGARALSESDVKLRDAILALISLGYKRTEAQDMVTRVIGDSAAGQESVEELVRKALAR
ncbi:MAG: Holliday junction branch migration protein RuvA [bacterium]|jgi:Holliday junction DNA helicase RuvA